MREEHQPDPWGAVPDDGPGDDVGGVGDDDGDGRSRKYYFDSGQVEIAAHMVHEIDPDGHQLRVVKYTDYTAEKVRTLYPNAHALRQSWSQPENRGEIIEAPAERGIDFEQLVEVSGQPDADPFDLLCHVAFNAPLRTRRERAQRLRCEKRDFFEKYGLEARAILNVLLDKYTEFGDCPIHRTGYPGGPADLGAGQPGGDRRPVRRCAATAGCGQRIANAVVRGIV